MKYRVVSASDGWSTDRLTKKTEEIINKETENGWKLISVSLGFSVWWIPTVFITLAQ